VDNLCHTLTGAAIAEAGLKTHTRFGSAALMIAANLPDIDVLAFMTGTPSVALRRGWTHGILAQATLPIVLTGAFVLIDRWRRPPTGASRVNAVAMLLLCYAGVLSHVGMDWLNNYGVRLLMPWSSRWFYGDAVFIVDPWLWLVLAGGAILARRGRRRRIAGVALLLAAAYIAAMTLSARAAREYVRGEWAARTGREPVSLMVGPVPVSPFRKTVIVDGGDHYQRGTFTWFPRRVTFEPESVPKRATEPAALQASLTPEFQAILVWSRFPYYELTKSEDGGTRVTLADMRFGPRLFHATTTVRSP
jgi:inner membrane protein